MPPILEREEYIEQAYFFHQFRERLGSNLPAQEVLEHVHEEILSTTRLPMAIQFLATELKHSGLLASGFTRLSHYFTPFQSCIIRSAEDAGQRFTMDTALLILEREAEYRTRNPSVSGLFVYQFESLCRNRIGYEHGITAMAGDPIYDATWRAYLEFVRVQVGLVDFADLIYLRSTLFVQEQHRKNPDYDPPLPPIFGEKEGKIAKANRDRDPLYLFAALQRHLNYPEVPRPRTRDDLSVRLEVMQTKLHELETRLKLAEGEIRGQVDLNKFGTPEMFRGEDE